MSHTDTNPAACPVRNSAVSGEQRIMLAFEMSLFARELAKEGIRREHPEWQEAQVGFPEPLPSWIPSASESSEESVWLLRRTIESCATKFAARKGAAYCSPGRKPWVRKRRPSPGTTERVPCASVRILSSCLSPLQGSQRLTQHPGLAPWAGF